MVDSTRQRFATTLNNLPTQSDDCPVAMQVDDLGRHEGGECAEGRAHVLNPLGFVCEGGIW